MNDQIWVAPPEAVAGRGTAESPFRVWNIDDTIRRSAGRTINLARGKYLTNGCGDEYYSDCNIVGNGSEIAVDSDREWTRDNIGIIRTMRGSCVDVKLRGPAKAPPPGCFVKEGWFSRGEAYVERLSVRGLNSSKEAGMEAFAILCHGDDPVEIRDSSAADCGEYATAFATRQYAPKRPGIIDGCFAEGVPIAYAFNHRTSISNCAAIECGFVLYSDTDDVSGIIVDNLYAESCRYAAVGFKGGPVDGVTIRDSAFEFAKGVGGIGAELTCERIDRLEFVRSTFRSGGDFTVASCTAPYRILGFDSCTLPDRRRHNIRGAAVGSLRMIWTRNRTWSGNIVTIAASDLPGTAAQ